MLNGISVGQPAARPAPESDLYKPGLTTQDGADWTRRAEYWIAVCPGRDTKRSREPLIITGHNMSLRVHRGALDVADGFTHYPQPRDTQRIFPGDPLPSRIVMLDGSGSITLDAIDWLAVRGIPLLRVDYRGLVVSCIGTTPDTRGIDPHLAGAQREAASDAARAIALATWLVREKLLRCRAVVEELTPESPSRTRALERLDAEAAMLATHSPGSLDALLGVEGINARLYFDAWKKLPLVWKGTGGIRYPNAGGPLGRAGHVAS